MRRLKRLSTWAISWITCIVLIIGFTMAMLKSFHIINVAGFKHITCRSGFEELDDSHAICLNKSGWWVVNTQGYFFLTQKVRLR